MKKKILLSAIIALSLALLVAVGGTIAYLFTDTQDVVNTFTYGDINITLQEEASDIDDGDNNANTNEYKMIPDSDLTKKPSVTVLADSEACWLFIKVTKSANFDKFLEYTIAGGWTELQTVNNDTIYYREVPAETAKSGVVYEILSGNKVHVKNTVTKVMLNNLDITGNEGYPTLSFHAYAVQHENVDTAAEAWAIAENKGVPVANS